MQTVRPSIDPVAGNEFDDGAVLSGCRVPFHLKAQPARSAFFGQSERRRAGAGMPSVQQIGLKPENIGTVARTHQCFGALRAVAGVKRGAAFGITACFAARAGERIGGVPWFDGGFLRIFRCAGEKRLVLRRIRELIPCLCFALVADSDASPHFRRRLMVVAANASESPASNVHCTGCQHRVDVRGLGQIVCLAFLTLQDPRLMVDCVEFECRRGAFSPQTPPSPPEA